MGIDNSHLLNTCESTSAVLQFSFEFPEIRKMLTCCNKFRRWATKTDRELEHMVYEKKLKELGLFSIGKRRLRGDLIAMHNYLMQGCQDGGTVPSQRHTVKGQESMDTFLPQWQSCVLRHCHNRTKKGSKILNYFLILKKFNYELAYCFYYFTFF